MVVWARKVGCQAARKVFAWGPHVVTLSVRDFDHHRDFVPRLAMRAGRGMPNIAAARHPEISFESHHPCR